MWDIITVIISSCLTFLLFTLQPVQLEDLPLEEVNILLDTQLILLVTIDILTCAHPVLSLLRYSLFD